MSCFVLLKNEQELVKNQMDFHNKMYLLSHIDPGSYERVCDLIKQAFPFIIDTQLKIISDILPGVNLPVKVVGDSCQFIMTSHHPYIINNIDISSWKVFYRNGLDVEILNGESLKKKFLSSKQEHFTQLINNKFYSEGIA